jgi:TonB family protein
MRNLAFIACLLSYSLAYGSAENPSNFFYRVSPAGAPLKIEPFFYAPKPDYPYEARKNHFEGAGLFELHIRPDGRVESVKVIKSIGHSILDQAAIEAFRRWTVRPHSIEVVRLPIEYMLRRFTGPPYGRARLKERGHADTAVVSVADPPR